jgi:hypothetical protein
VTLVRVLAEWKLAGWERTYGRMPTAADLVSPTRNESERSPAETIRQLHADLDMLGLRRRRGHDLRRTFITLAHVDDRDLLETISHGPRGDIDGFATVPQTSRNRWQKKWRPQRDSNRLTSIPEKPRRDAALRRIPE